MACFLIPTAEAIVITAVRKGLEKKEKKQDKVSAPQGSLTGTGSKIPFSGKLKSSVYPVPALRIAIHCLFLSF